MINASAATDVNLSPKRICIYCYSMRYPFPQTVFSSVGSWGFSSIFLSACEYEPSLYCWKSRKTVLPKHFRTNFVQRKAAPYKITLILESDTLYRLSSIRFRLLRFISVLKQHDTTPFQWGFVINQALAFIDLMAAQKAFDSSK